MQFKPSLHPLVVVATPGRQAADIVGRHLGRQVKLRSAGPLIADTEAAYAFADARYPAERTCYASFRSWVAFAMNIASTWVISLGDGRAVACPACYFATHCAGRFQWGPAMSTENPQRFLITDIVTCNEGFHQKWSHTLIYNVQTESGRVILEMIIDAVKKIRAMPDPLPPWLVKLGGVWE